MSTDPGGALVTGAGRGLGRGIAGLLADRGHTVAVTDVDLALAEEAAAEIGRGAFALELDVRDDDALRGAAEAVVERTGRLAVWVNNAGVLLTGRAWDQDAAVRRLMIEVNALGTMNGTLAALEAMRATGGGHIVNIVSLAGLVPAPGEAVYAASKHAAIGFSLSLAADLRLEGVTGIDISCVCPDGMWTPMLHDKLDDPGAAMSFTGTLLQPDEVVAAVAGVLDRPRPVTSIPKWRGAQVRLIDTIPRVAIAAAPAFQWVGTRAQRRFRRRGV